MNIVDEIDKIDEEMEEEYRELYPPTKRRFTFTEMREKHRKKKPDRIMSTKEVNMEEYIKKTKCIMKGCIGIVETHWDKKNGFKNANCPICKTLFEPYLETKLRLMEVMKEE